MITEGIVRVFVAMAEALIGLVPSISLPSWASATALDGYAEDVAEWVSPWAGWVPFPVVFGVGLVLMQARAALAVTRFVLAVKAAVK